MEHIHVNVYIHAPVARVFDAISDHEHFLSTEQVHTKLLQPGAVERNGLGALRQVKVGRRVRYLEEITAWSRDSSFEYQVKESWPPLRHHGSRLTFTPRGEGTEVDWTSRIEVPVPVLGRTLAQAIRGRLTLAFSELLMAAKARLEAAPRN